MCKFKVTIAEFDNLQRNRSFSSITALTQTRRDPGWQDQVGLMLSLSKILLKPATFSYFLGLNKND